MIPDFPNMKSLALSDRGDVESITRQFDPYSDFNFISLWSWDTEGTVRLSMLHGNLVVLFADYTTFEPFFMFIGPGDASVTAAALIAHSREIGMAASLRLVPACIAERIDTKDFLVEESADHRDYIVSVQRLTVYEGQKLALQRNFVRRFLCAHPDVRFAMLDLFAPEICTQVEALHERWHQEKHGALPPPDDHEGAALRRCYQSFPADLFATGLFDGDTLVALSLAERVNDRYAIVHFEKTESSRYVGIGPHLRQQTARMLAEGGTHYINLEQDLGIAGLRQSKRSYAPVHFLNKCHIRRRDPGSIE